jgi:hypothetical protein
MNFGDLKRKPATNEVGFERNYCQQCRSKKY